MSNDANDAALKDIERAYDSPPLWYDIRGFFILTFAYRSSLWRQIGLFGGNMGPEHLEAAIGSGTLAGIILLWRRLTGQPRIRMTGFDYAAPMLAGAIRRFRGNANVRLLKADVTQLDFPDATFDSANVANAIHCFPDVDAALRELFRVLKPGGSFATNVLLVPRGPWPLKGIAERIDAWGMRKGILFRPYERDDMRARVIATGFAIRREQVTGNTYEIVAEKPGS